MEDPCIEGQVVKPSNAELNSTLMFHLCLIYVRKLFQGDAEIEEHRIPSGEFLKKTPSKGEHQNTQTTPSMTTFFFHKFLRNTRNLMEISIQCMAFIFHLFLSKLRSNLDFS